MDYRYNARNIRVIDGDTIEAEIDLGFRIFRKDVFRLAGIQAPERGQPATDYIKTLIDGKTIVLESRKAEKYGRWLATVFADGVDVNQAMVDAGHAVAYFGGKR